MTFRYMLAAACHLTLLTLAPFNRWQDWQWMCCLQIITILIMNQVTAVYTAIIVSFLFKNVITKLWCWYYVAEWTLPVVESCYVTVTLFMFYLYSSEYLPVLGYFICYNLIGVVLVHMEYRTCEEQLRYFWPFSTGYGRMKLPAPAFSISLLCNFYCPLVRHIHLSYEKHLLALYVCPSTCINSAVTGQIWYWRL